MLTLTVMNCASVLVLALLAGIGWHAGNWIAAKLLKA